MGMTKTGVVAACTPIGHGVKLTRFVFLGPTATPTEAAQKLPMPNLKNFTLGAATPLTVPNWSLGRTGRTVLGT